MADDLVRRHLQHRRAIDGDAARRRPVDARDDVEEGGLARAVGPDEADYLALLNLEGHPIQSDDSTEADRQVSHLEERHLGSV